jgi:hypothetical protein
MFGGLFAGTNLIMYSVAPYPMTLVLSWIGLSLVQSVLVGVAFAAIRGKENCSS